MRKTRIHKIVRSSLCPPKKSGACRPAFEHKALVAFLAFTLVFYPSFSPHAFPLGPFGPSAAEQIPVDVKEVVSKAKEAVSEFTFKSISDVAINAGNLVTLTLRALSPTANPVRYDVEDLPDGASLVDKEFRWLPDSDVVGEHTIVFRASDGVDTKEQVVTFFFVPSDGLTGGRQSATEKTLLASRSALVLPDREGWLVVIPAARPETPSEKLPEKKKKKEENDISEGEFRVDEGAARVGPNVTLLPDDGSLSLGGFFVPTFGNLNQTPAPPADDGDESSGGDDGSADDGSSDEPAPDQPDDGGEGEEEENFDTGLRFFDHIGGNNGPLPANNPLLHHTFQSANILSGLGNIVGRAAVFGDLSGHASPDSLKNFLDIYVANPYRQIDLTPYNPDPPLRNVLLVNSAPPSGEATFTDKTLERGADMSVPPSELDRPESVLLGDIDNDGLRDIFMANLGRPNVLLKNQGPGSLFANISGAAGINSSGEARASVMADFNLDGLLDIFVAYGSHANKLYLNLDGALFFDAAGTLGLTGFGRTVGVVTFDADRDGDCDLYLLNHSSSNRLMKNLVKETGFLSFTDVSASAGVNLTGTPSGAEAGDLDNDGDYDLFVADLAIGGARLFRNNSIAGDIDFTDVTSSLVSVLGGGLIPGTTGAAFLDIDNQGLFDIYVLTENDENIMFGNNGGFNFTDITASEIVAYPFFADSVATGDYNNDNKTDIFISSTPSLLYKNISSHTNHYLKILLRPTSIETNTDSVGARVEVLRKDGVRLTQQLMAGTGRSQDSNVLLFGMAGSPGADEVKVYWPNVPGRVTTLLDSDLAVDLHADQTLVIGDNVGPEIMMLADQLEAAAGVLSTFEIVTKDVNGDAVNLTYSVLSGPLASDDALLEQIVSDGINTTWRFTFTASGTGVAVVRFIADDGLSPSVTTRDVTISVIPAVDFNTAPEFFTALPDSITINAGEAMSELDILAHDQDNIAAGILDAFVSVTPDIPPGQRPFLEDVNDPPVIVSTEGKSRFMKLKWTPDESQVGIFEVTITLDDGLALTSDSVTITVESQEPGEDTEPPVLLSSNPPDGSTVSELKTIEFILSDNVDVDEAETAVSVTHDGVLLVEGANYTRDNSAENKVVLMIDESQDGLFVFTITPADMAGNVGPPVMVTITDVPTLFLDKTLGADGYFGPGANPISPEAQAVVVADYNRDTNGIPSANGTPNALEDLLILTGGGSASQLFRLTSTAGPYQDVTSSANLPSAALDSRGAAVADFNKDGFKDIFVVNSASHQLFLGNAASVFSSDSAALAGVSGNGSGGRGVLLADVNNDGLLDLYVLRDGRNVLYLNRFDGTTLTFENVTEGAADTGIGGSETADSVAGLFFDPDGDGDPDLYVVNVNKPNQLFLHPGFPLNASDPLGPFVDVAGAVSLNNDTDGKVGLATADINGDNAFDLFLIHSDPSLSQMLVQDPNDLVDVGGGAEMPRFQASVNTGIDLADDLTIASATVRDAVFIDFDNDGDQDLSIAASREAAPASEILLHENDGTGHFALVDGSGLVPPAGAVIKSLTRFDANQDGHLDMLALGTHSQLFLNGVINNNSYIQIAFNGVVSNHLGLATRVTVQPEGSPQTLSGVVFSGTGTDQDSTVLHLGLGGAGGNPAIINHIVAAWPRGKVSFVEDDGAAGPFFSNQRLTISELGDSNLFLTISLEANPDNQVPDPGFENTLQLVNIPLNEFGAIVDGNGADNGVVQFRQYVTVDFALPGDGTFGAITLATDNRHSSPAYTGADSEKAAGLVGTTDTTLTVPLLWKVYNDSDAASVARPGHFEGDALGTEGLVQDKAQANFEGLDMQVLREVVTNVGGGTLGLYPPSEISTRVLDPENKIRVYLAADFSSPPDGSTWPPQDYKTSRIFFTLVVEA